MGKLVHKEFVSVDSTRWNKKGETCFLKPKWETRDGAQIFNFNSLLRACTLTPIGSCASRCRRGNYSREMPYTVVLPNFR